MWLDKLVRRLLSGGTAIFLPLQKAIWCLTFCQIWRSNKDLWLQLLSSVPPGLRPIKESSRSLCWHSGWQVMMKKLKAVVDCFKSSSFAASAFQFNVLSEFPFSAFSCSWHNAHDRDPRSRSWHKLYSRRCIYSSTASQTNWWILAERQQLPGMSWADGKRASKAFSLWTRKSAAVSLPSSCKLSTRNWAASIAFLPIIWPRYQIWQVQIFKLQIVWNWEYKAMFCLLKTAKSLSLSTAGSRILFLTSW